jgi:hypothetical protein
MIIFLILAARRCCNISGIYEMGLLPAVPWVSLSRMTGMMDRIESEAVDFDRRYRESLPLLDKMGYEVTNFRVEGGCCHGPNSAYGPR